MQPIPFTDLLPRLPPPSLQSLSISHFEPNYPFFSCVPSNTDLLHGLSEHHHRPQPLRLLRHLLVLDAGLLLRCEQKCGRVGQRMEPGKPQTAILKWAMHCSLDSLYQPPCLSIIPFPHPSVPTGHLLCRDCTGDAMLPLPTQDSPFRTSWPTAARNPNGRLLRHDPADGSTAPALHATFTLFPPFAHKQKITLAACCVLIP